jgi:hypothetical protein
MTVAKRQKKSNREIRKPKQPKAKVEPAPRSFLSPPDRLTGKSSGGAKRSLG